jgi:histidine ammonia-lyase
VFSRSTECHNQDKVSMGTIAARDCLRVLELTEQVAAALLVTVRQGVTLRRRVRGELAMTRDLERMQADLEARIPLIEEDRALDRELSALVGAIRDGAWDLYAP